MATALYLVHWGALRTDLQVYPPVSPPGEWPQPLRRVFTIHHLRSPTRRSHSWPLPLAWHIRGHPDPSLGLSILALALAVYVVCRRGGCRVVAPRGPVVGWASLASFWSSRTDHLDYDQVNTLLLSLVVVDLLVMPKAHRAGSSACRSHQSDPLIFVGMPLLDATGSVAGASAPSRAPRASLAVLAGRDEDLLGP